MSALNSSRDAAPIIELIDLDVAASRAPRTVVVENVEWRIHAGDYWAVGGRAGAGKSDLLGTVSGLFRPARGTVRLFGTDVSEFADDESVAVRQRVGLVFEHGARLFRQMTVRENVALPVRYHCAPPTAAQTEHIECILDATELASFADVAPGRLSLAQRQRTGLARALALKPEVLLLDNPLAGLDPAESRWWREFLARLLAGDPVTDNRPLTLIVTCHDLRPWADHAQQFALLNRRRWTPVGGQRALNSCEDPLLHELLEAKAERP